MRIYLDHNATTPLRAEARSAMLAAMDVVGNPSSVHAEGRAAKALVERARAQVARLVNAEPSEVVFCGSATEAASMVLAMPWNRVIWSGVEHDCIGAHAGAGWLQVALDDKGIVSTDGISRHAPQNGDLIAIQAANSETGITQNILSTLAEAEKSGATALLDAVQHAGKLSLDLRDLPTGALVMLSAHKLGGPKGIGALIVPRGMDVPALIKGGGQEMGRRSGTENVIAIAGFGAAAEAAGADVAQGKWDRVAELRNILENSLEAADKKTIFVGKEAPRLPNTSCIIADGWKGETQVMQMDLSGFAISAGSACSSGKVKASSVLQTMGYSKSEASSAIRVSLGLETTEEDVMRFADAWRSKRDRHEERAA